MSTFFRAALVGLALVSAASAASAVTRYDNDNALNWNTDTRSFFEQLQRNGD